VYRRAQDVAITSAVKTKMFASRTLKSNNFKIVTEDGVVFILGAATPKQANLAVSIARESAGVKKVVKLIEGREE
jgi:osmotically-inducible protein OsmY